MDRVYIPGKDYWVAGARNAYDVVPVGLFNTLDEAWGCFPLSKKNIFRKATALEIKQFFNLPLDKPLPQN